MRTKKILAVVLGLVLLSVIGVTASLLVISAQLPKMVTVADYKPLLVSEVYSNNGEKIGEFFRERRIVVPYEKFPKKLVEAFLAAEDSSFFEHGGINFTAIIRAFFANMRAGRAVQGGSTITQQVAKSILQATEKTYMRKIREAIFSYRMEAHLGKEDILYLYLNQIYLGQGAYGVAMAAQTYFRKNLDQLTLAEMALLAGLPQAPSRYSPIHNPLRAKERQRYVLTRMKEEGFISAEESQKSGDEPVSVYMREDYKDKAPFFLETVRQHLVKTLGESAVLDQGLKIHTSIDVEKQVAAQKHVQDGLRELDKRQGYRGAPKNLAAAEEVAKFLLETRDKLIDDYTPLRTIVPDGRALPEKEPLNLTRKPDQKNLPEYIPVGTIVEGIVTKVDDQWGLVTVRFAETQGMIDLETMEWARKPNPNVIWENDKLKKPSDALKVGDVIQVKVTGQEFSSKRINEMLANLKKKQKNYTPPTTLPEFKQFAAVELEQDPVVQGALLSFDLETQNILAMVGGNSFEKSEFNRALQAIRQTGSSFKPLVYAAALDHGYTPATVIVDAPIVYEEEGQLDGDNKQIKETKDDEAIKKWKPNNYSEKFTGDILFRNALIKSLNIPTVKILEKVTVDTTAMYARRLGIFSPLNMDLSLGLGSSGVTLYEMTKVFSHFGRLGKRIRPLFILKVTDQQDKTLLENVSLDMRFEEELKKLDADFEEKRLAFKNQKPEDKKKLPPIFFDDPDQLIAPQTAYLTTSLLKGVVDEGTGAKAKALGRTVAGKTGTTNGYYDAWFVGYTPQISTGVWVGSDVEKTLGRGETGGQAALPIWLEYMKVAVKNVNDRSFPVPPGIVSVSIDNETGNLGSASSKELRH
ncbi:MAG TPA: PBP1A family penicillin-binding protein, partial [Bdellovibrionales bacterium]|nr:PBP1A family penicillin-binding protein [Bdellovibrionales bacterium]